MYLVSWGIYYFLAPERTENIWVEIQLVSADRWASRVGGHHSPLQSTLGDVRGGDGESHQMEV